MRPIRTFLRPLTALLSVAVLVLAACGDDTKLPVDPTDPSLAIGVDDSTGASIETDKDDYFPGEIVKLVMKGWAPNEVVHMTMSEDPDTHMDVDTTLTMDANGEWSGDFYEVQDTDLGVTFQLTGTGPTSGSVVIVVFTDGNPGTPTVSVAQSPDPVTAGNSATYTISIPFTGTSASCTVNLSAAPTASPAWPAAPPGGYFSFSPSSVTGANATGQTLKQSVLTLTTPAGMAAGTYKFTVLASITTGCQGANRTSAEINLVVQAGNQNPVLSAIGNKSILEATELAFTATATDADVPAQTLTFSLGTPAATCGYPTATGAAITSGGAFTWTPTEAQGPATYCARVEVSDGASGSDFEDFQIQVTEGNSAPELAAIGNKSVNELVQLAFTATATDGDLPAQTLTFTLGTPDAGCGYPTAAGASITSGGAFTWTPTEAQGPGTYCARIQVSDGASGSDHEDIQISVDEVNLDPVLASIGNKSVNELVQLAFTATATDDDLPTQTLTFTLGTPAAACGDGEADGANITSGGAFTWTPTEAQGPGTYCARIQVSDANGGSDFEDVQIAVAEVNVAPVLTVPASFSTQWGVTPTNRTATALDADLPANTLTFSKVSGPSWVTVGSDGTISFSVIPAAAVGPQVVRVRVQDNGSPVLGNEEEFTITVQTRTTSLVYDGRTAGEYSDESTLSATLKDVGTDAPAGGTPISGETISFSFAGGVVGSGTTNASGYASYDHTVASAAGNTTASASYAGANGYSASGPASAIFVVDQEDAEIAATLASSSIPVSQTSFTVNVGVKELRILGVEPNINDGALPGNIGLVTALTAQITGMATNTNYPGVCGAGSGGSASYGSTQSFTCTFSGGPFVVDAYALTISIPSANTYYEALAYEDALSVWDPNAGFANGGGTFMLDNDRVSFGFSYTQSKGKTGGVRSGFVVVRHLTGGGVCRVKSNNGMNAPAVNSNTVTLSGTGNYTCSFVDGTSLGKGNISVAAYAEDNATSGAGYDKFWVTNGAVIGGHTNTLAMPTPAGANAQLLRGGNVQVPQPQRKP